MRVIEGDCLAVMAGMEANSVDAIVTDPPYGLKFMGKDWDHGVPGSPFWAEALRVAKPGAHLLAFGGTRTFHRLAVAIEDAGWEIRDTIMWVYGSGFPKSLDISKAIDREAGAEREVAEINPNFCENRKDSIGTCNGIYGVAGPDKGKYITAPSTPAARQWSGWGTALKPAWEPILVCRKPVEGTVAANVLKWGTGGINVDGGRIEAGEKYSYPNGPKGNTGRGAAFDGVGMGRRECSVKSHSLGRFPANLILTFPEDMYILRDDVTPDQLHKLAEWMNENAKQ